MTTHKREVAFGIAREPRACILGKYKKPKTREGEACHLPNYTFVPPKARSMMPTLTSLITSKFTNVEVNITRSQEIALEMNDTSLEPTPRIASAKSSGCDDSLNRGNQGQCNSLT